MARQPIEINKEEYQKVLSEVESNHKPTSRQSLFQLICGTEWAQNLRPRPLQPQTAMLKAKEFALIITTPLGRRGDGLEQARTIKHERKKRIVLPEVAMKLKSVIPPAFASKLEKTIKGSLKAAIALKCLDCCAFDKKEIAHCTIQQCSLWSFRPYKAQEKSNEG